MRKKDILELKKRFKKDHCTFTKMCGCYVNGEKNILLKFRETFLNLEDEEFISDLEVIKKVIKKEINEINLMEIKSLGELFNPELHRCLAVEKNKSKVENQIISVVEKGYMLNGRVIRPASVIIVK